MVETVRAHRKVGLLGFVPVALGGFSVLAFLALVACSVLLQPQPALAALLPSPTIARHCKTHQHSQIHDAPTQVHDAPTYHSFSRKHQHCQNFMNTEFHDAAPQPKLHEAPTQSDSARCTNAIVFFVTHQHGHNFTTQQHSPNCTTCQPQSGFLS